MNDELIERLRTTEQMLNAAHFKEAESLIREARDAIEKLQSKQSERKKGKWIDRRDYCVCDQCGHTEQQFNGVEPIPLHTPFCATCGAEMEKTNAEDIH